MSHCPLAQLVMSETIFLDYSRASQQADDVLSQTAFLIVT